MIGYLILQVIEDSVPKLRVIGWILLMMIIVILILLADEGITWNQPLKNGVFFSGLAVLITLLFISILNYFHFNPKQEAPDKELQAQRFQRNEK